MEKLYGFIRRNKRSTSITFPNDIGFRFLLKNGDVTFELERSVLPEKITPMYVLGKDTKLTLHSNREQVRISILCIRKWWEKYTLTCIHVYIPRVRLVAITEPWEVIFIFCYFENTYTKNTKTFKPYKRVSHNVYKQGLSLLLPISLVDSMSMYSSFPMNHTAH